MSDTSAEPGSLRNAGPWEHLDGTPCPYYVASRPRPSADEYWWCTEHQQHVRPAEPVALTPEQQLLHDIFAEPDAGDVEALARVTGRSLIDAERARQQAKGYSVHHDREHGPHALYRAANCYAHGDRLGWPWTDDDWKPRDLLSNLVRAGALFQAALSVADPAKDKISGWVGEKPKHIRRRRDEVAAQIDAILASPVIAAHVAEVRRTAAKETAEAWKVAAQRRNEARRYYVAWMSARMRAQALARGEAN